MAFEFLQELIKPSAIIPVDAQTNRAFLTEPSCPDSKVELCGLPRNTLVIRADLFAAPSDIFNGSRGECKRADFIVFSEQNDAKHILFIEMKRTSDSEKTIIQQFKGAKAFVGYCEHIANNFWSKRNVFNGFEERFVSFSHTSVSKRPSRTKTPAKHDKPELMLKYSSPGRVAYKHLVA